MHDNFDDPEFNEEVRRQMNLVLTVALRNILHNQSHEKFLAWAQESLPSLSSTMFGAIPEEDRRQAAYWLGVNIWNVAPLPDNNYQPRPLQRPGRNDICPCGSGKKHKHCCLHLPVFDPLPSDLFWPLLGEVLPEKELVRLSREHKLPAEAIGAIAYESYEEENFPRVIKLLEPLFDENAARLTQHDSGLLDMLCDAYGYHYKTDKKKTALLERMSRHREPVIRAEAWQRIASLRHDSGDSAGAHEALANAMKSDPNNPTHSLLELVLLVTDNQIELAKQRAGFWLRKLQRFEHEYPEIVETLRRAKSDPAAALQRQLRPDGGDDQIARLIEWVERNISRPIPHYQVVPLDHPEEDLDSEFDLDLEEDGPDHPHDDPMQNAVCLEPSSELLTLEADWAGCTPVGKPFSTQYASMDDEDIWDNPIDDSWVEFLEENPRAIDSLDILDDILSVVYAHPANETPFGPLRDMKPLLERAHDIIVKANVPAGKNLPWIMPENRPALRLLSHLIHMSDRTDKTRSEKLMEEYLALNPSDNHGFRVTLINCYLKSGRNEEALALAEKYPEDLLAEILYGKVLAHYRLGQLKEAKTALEKAHEDLSLVAGYLIKAKVAKPKMQSFGFSINSREQAWIYREAMRDQWLATPNCLEWLKKNI